MEQTDTSFDEYRRAREEALTDDPPSQHRVSPKRHGDPSASYSLQEIVQRVAEALHQPVDRYGTWNAAHQPKPALRR